MKLVMGIMAINAIWHGLAGWHFALFPERTIRRYTLNRAVPDMARELMRFLGALNAAISALGWCALWMAPMASLWLLFTFFMLANLSQFVVDVHVHRLGLTNRHFVPQILVGDGVVAGLNLVAAVMTRNLV